MTGHSDQRTGGTEFLGVWEDQWRARATLAGHAERYRLWLRTQGYSREAAAERAVRFLAANPPTFHLRPPAPGPTVH